MTLFRSSGTAAGTSAARRAADNGTDDDSTAAASASGVRTELGFALRLGLVCTPLLLGGLVAWAGMTPLHGAVIAQGSAVAEGENRKVQHLDGGIVSALHVRNGDHVAAGEVLLSLDPTLLETNLGIVRSRLAETLARVARLQLEEAIVDPPLPGIAQETGARTAGQTEAAAQLQAGQDAAPALPVLDRSALQDNLPARQLLGDPEGQAALETALAGQSRILAARAALRESQRAQTLERIAQLQGQTGGLDGLIDAQEAQIASLSDDIGRLDSLVSQGLAARPRLLEIERARSEILGEMAQNRSERAGLANAIREARLDQAKTESQFREEVATDRREASGQVEELVQQLITYRAQLSRVDLRAPVSGIVHQMSVVTLGGVIAPGDTVAEIVPQAGGVEFDLRLAPQSVDEVMPGQKARLKFPGLPATRAPEIFGRVAMISPSTIEDPRSGEHYYRLRLEVPASELARLPEPPVPGMPVEAFLETSERTALAWLMKPLRDHLDRAFRED